MPQLRQNIITGDWVVIAPERARRPDEYVTAATVRRQAKDGCPFCNERTEHKHRLKDFETKNIYIIPNKFPAFVEQDGSCDTRSQKIEDDFYRVKPATGGHDVVVVKDHELNLPDFSEKIWLEMMQIFQKRYKYFASIGAFYTMPIYNHGPEAGASIEHPHSQIFASNIIPNIPARELEHSLEYFDHNGQCVFCDLIKHEKKFRVRIIFENEAFVAFTFYAARFPFEIWILPKHHQDRLENESQKNLEKLAECLKVALGKLNKALNDPPLNIFWHSLPNTIKSADYYHWHIEIAPRITGYGGFEMGAGTIIDVFSPERAAGFLNKK